MTSHTLASFKPHELSSSMEASCSFCKIAAGQSEAHVVYEDKENIAFLDILPLRKGHALVVPKKHIQQVSMLQPDQAASLAKALVTVTRALGKALGDERLQVITNQIYAQIVPHVHFHIVPAPPLPGSARAASTETKAKPSSPMSLFGHGREELDDEEAVQLVKLTRSQVEDLGQRAKL